jgi:hypothetical protein
MSAAPARLLRAVLLIACSLLFGAAALVTDARAAGRLHHGSRIHVWLKSPRAMSTVEGVVPCHVVVHDRRGIRKVRFSLDGRHLNTRFARPYNCSNAGNGRLDTKRLAEGRHRLSLRAWSRTGRSRLVRLSFFVQNVASTAGKPWSSGRSDPADLLFDGTHLANFAQLQEAASDRIQEMRDPLGSGAPVLKFHVRNSDVYPATPTDNPRAQALSPNIIHTGMEFWVKDSVMLPASFPSDIPWLDLLEVYGAPYNGSSPVSLQVIGDQIALQRNRTYHDDMPWKMPVVRDRWTSFLLHEHFGPEGWVELWVNGQQVTFSNGQQRLHMATEDASNDGGPNHVKIASYRTLASASDVTMYHAGFRFGLTRASVLG